MTGIDAERAKQLIATAQRRGSYNYFRVHHGTDQCDAFAKELGLPIESTEQPQTAGVKKNSLTIQF
jgi:hypothetical protein